MTAPKKEYSGDEVVRVLEEGGGRVKITCTISERTYLLAHGFATQLEVSERKLYAQCVKQGMEFMLKNYQETNTGGDGHGYTEDVDGRAGGEAEGESSG